MALALIALLAIGILALAECSLKRIGSRLPSNACWPPLSAIFLADFDRSLLLSSMIVCRRSPGHRPLNITTVD